MPNKQASIRMYPIAERQSLVKANDLSAGCPPLEDDGDIRFGAFIDALPDVLAAVGARKLLKAWAQCVRSDGNILFGFGGHVVKTSLGAWLRAAMTRRYITHLATNGAGIIHDLELAYFGETSEDVAEALPQGRFGFARETQDLFARAVSRAREGEGLGEAVKAMILADKPPHHAGSLVWTAAQLEIPLFVHVALGCDIVHMNPELDGAALGAASLRDFWHFADTVCQLQNGLFVLAGSAVILPEVFLKAVSVAINQGTDLSSMTSAVFDFIRQYRVRENVLTRPPGESIELIGHHEIMIPLILTALRDKLKPTP